MKNLGYDNPLYILPFDHRSSFELKMFGWGEDLTPEQTAEIAGAKQAIYDGFKAAVEAGVHKEKAGVLVAGVPGFIGFAVGRTSFWNPLVDLRAKKIMREDAVAEIARRYREFVEVFESVRAKTRAA
jgi:myo-inositol catabolism protein IolC